MNLKQFIITLLCFFSVNLVAQRGVLSGKIVDKKSGESLIGAIVEVKKGGSPVAGIVSDMDGNYFVELEEGTYELGITYLSYAKYAVSDIVIKPKEVLPLDVALEEETVSLVEIIVKAESVRTTDVALIALQRKASGIQDGISSQQISRTGSSNAADAIRQMPGSLIQDGRYIVIRGLGDRYSISQLNGVTLPSTDPYRNSSSLDLIPSQVIDNIVAVKTFTPDLPGNFSGGMVNINTKSIPDKFNLSIGVSTAYNSQSSLVDNFQLSPTQGKYDWLGFDDGSRNQPALLLDPSIREQLSTSTYLNARQPGHEALTSIFNETSHQLSNSFLPVAGQAPLNMGFNFALGHRFPVFKKDFGFTVSLNYANQYQHYDDGIVATYINTNTDFLFPYQKLYERKSVQNPSLGGLFNMAYKLSDNHILSGNVIFNNDAELISRSQSGEFLGQVSNSLAVFNTNSVEFIQRQLANFQFGGKHVMTAWNNIGIDWNIAKTISLQNEPDLKYFAYTTVTEDPGTGEAVTEYYMNNAEYAFPYHFFRKLQDDGFEGKLDITIPFGHAANPSLINQVKIGGLYNTTDREFEEYRYQLNNSGIPSTLNFTSFGGDFDAFWDPANFGIIDTLYTPDGTVQRYVTGYHYVNQINARNFYTGNSTIASAYAMLTYNITSRLKAVGGLRMEETDMSVVSRDTLVDEGKIDQTDFLYSVNLIYALSEKSNLRMAGSKTLARPNMRELAPFVQFDTKNGFFNVGNPNLNRTLIRNLDIRYELYPNSGELIAVSAFYKMFDDPIIRAFNPKATIPELSFINVDAATVIGAEIELRKELNFISPALKQFYFNMNVAVIHSAYAIPEEEIDNSKNIDPEYNETTRPFQGQAPYIVNAILSYINPDNGLELSLAYNVSGKKLYNISLFATPDVYEQPQSLLNFKASKRFGQYYQLNVTARNLLNASNEKIHDFNGRTYVAESNSIGRTFGASFIYTIR